MKTSSALFALLVGSITATATGQDGALDGDERGDRLRVALERNPRPGTAFDLWVRTLLEEGSLDQAVEAQRQRAASTEEVADDLVLALLLQRTGAMAEAGEVLARTAAATETPLAAQLHGEWLARERRLDEAVEAYRTALSRRPGATDRLDLQLRLGRLYLRVGREEEAMATWEALLEEHPRDRMLREELADLLAGEGRLDDARARWAEARDLEPNNPSVQYACTMEIARLHERDGDVGAVRAALMPLLDRLDGGSWQAREVLARIVQSYLSRRDVDGLVDCFTERLAQKPDDLAARLALVDALDRVGRYGAARDELREAIRVAPQHVDLRERLVVLLVRAARWDEAEQACLAWMQAMPTEPNPHQVLGEIILRRAGWKLTNEDLRRALNAWASIADLDDDDSALALRVAQLCHTLARDRTRRDGGEQLDGRGITGPVLEAAEQFYLLALERDDHRVAARDGYGQFLEECGRRGEALDQWRAMAAPPMDTPERLEQVVDALARVGEIDEALSALDRAIAATDAPRRLLEKSIRLRTERDTVVVDEPLMRVFASLEAGCEDDTALERVLQLRVDVLAQADALEEECHELIPRFQESALGRDGWLLGLVHAARGEQEFAITALRSATTYAPDRPRIAFALADALERGGKAGEAARQFQALADTHPSLAPRCLERITLLELAREDFSAAARAAEALLVRAPGSLDAARLAADVARRAGDDDRALEILRGAVRSAPRDVGLRATLAQLLAELGQPLEAAEQCWQAFLDETDEEGRRALAQNVGLFAADANRVDTFVERLNSRIRRTPDDRHLDVCLADLLVAAEQIDEALDHLERLHTADPGSIPVLEHLVERADALHSPERASEYARRLTELDPTSDRLESLAKLQTKAGLREEARATWMRVLDSDPARADALVPDIEALVKSEQVPDALDLAYAATQAAPESVPLRRWAAALALDQGDLDAMEEHFGALLVAPAAGGVIQRGRSNARGMSAVDLPALALLPPLMTANRPSWFEDSAVALLRTLPAARLAQLLRYASGQVDITVTRDQGQMRMEYVTENGGNGSSSGPDTEESGPSFSISVDTSVILRASRGSVDVDVDATLQRLQALGYVGSGAGGGSGASVQSRIRSTLEQRRRARAAEGSGSQPAQAAPLKSLARPTPPPVGGSGSTSGGSSSRPASRPARGNGPSTSASSRPSNAVTPSSSPSAPLARSLSAASRSSLTAVNPPQTASASQSSRSTGRSTSQPSVPSRPRSISRTSAETGGSNPSSSQAVPWPDCDMFEPFKTALSIGNRYSAVLRDQGDWAHYPANFRTRIVSPATLAADRTRTTSLMMLMHVAIQKGRFADWLTEMRDHPDASLRDELVPILLVHGHEEEACAMLEFAPSRDALEVPAYLLTLSAQVHRGALTDDVVVRAVEATDSLASHGFNEHFQLALISHLVTAERFDEAIAVYESRVAKTSLAYFLELVPWMTRTGDEDIQEMLFQHLLEEASGLDDPDLLDSILLALVRDAPELFWFEAADLLVERIRRCARDGIRSYDTEITVRLDHRVSQVVMLTLPRPVASLDARSLALLTMLHQRVQSAGLAGELLDVLIEARDGSVGDVRLTMECAELSLRWLNGEREGPAERWTALRTEHPDDPSIALCEGYAHFEVRRHQEAAIALQHARRALQRVPADAPWRESVAVPLSSLSQKLQKRWLLGTPFDVADGLLQRLRHAPDDVDLAHYLPTSDDIVRAQMAMEERSDDRAALLDWLDRPTTIASGELLVSILKQQEQLEAFEEEITALIERVPDSDDALLFDFLVADARRETRRVVEHARRLSASEMRGTPLHPSYENGLRRLLEQEEDRESVMTALVRVLMGHLDRADGECCSRVLAALFDNYRQTNEENRATWLSALTRASVLPAPRPDFAYALAHFAAVVHASVLPDVIVPLLRLSDPHVQNEGGQRLLLDFYAPFLRDRFEALDDAVRTDLASTVQAIVLGPNLEGLPPVSTREIAQGLVHQLPLVGFMVECTAAAGALPPLRRHLTEHPAADQPVILATLLAVAYAEEDDRAVRDLFASLQTLGWAAPAFGDSYPLLEQVAFERLAEPLERALTDPSNDRVETAMALCEVHGAIGGTERVRLFARLASRADETRALEAALLLLMPEEGEPTRTLVEGLDALVPTLSNPEKAILETVRQIHLGDYDRSIRATNAAFTVAGRTQPRAYLLNCWCSLLIDPSHQGVGLLDACDKLYLQYPPNEFDRRLRARVDALMQGAAND